MPESIPMFFHLSRNKVSQCVLGAGYWLVPSLPDMSAGEKHLWEYFELAMFGASTVHSFWKGGGLKGTSTGIVSCDVRYYEYRRTQLTRYPSFEKVGKSRRTANFRGPGFLRGL